MYIDLSILNEGITQDKRRLPPLMPDFIDVDERDIDELLKFMASFSSQLNYYDTTNSVQGTWEEFFKTDVHVVLIMITRFNMFAYIDQFSAYENKLFLAENDADLHRALNDLFNFITSVLTILNGFRSNLILGTKDSRIIKDQDIHRIAEDFDDEALRLSSYINEASATLQHQFKVDFRYIFSDDKKAADSVDPIFRNGHTVNDRILNALPDIKQVFNDLGAKFNDLLGIATFYHDNIELLEKDYQPHMALCFSFLYLYANLQKKLNLTTKNHLDLYYKKILGIKLKSAVADTVHLVFEKEEASPDVRLPVGEELLAKVEGKPEPAVFTLDRPILITGAQIAEFKTLLLAEHKFGALTEVDVYNASYPFISAAAYLKNKIPATPWPLLGEDPDRPDTDSTMQMSNVGMLISSPLLYLPEGRRTISFQIYIDEPSFERLADYFTRYSAGKKDTEALSDQLLSDAFIIDYTDTKGWKTIERYAASLDIAERALNIQVNINNSDEFIDVYDAAIHGGSYNTEWPIFRLLVNNYSVNNPFTFLRNIKTERISIKANVRGSKAVKLQNSVGPISAASTSQLFGPLPSVGTYLDIKSSNIFNKYTKTFCIRLDWIDLPKERGGWETYYRAYNNKIVNSSFQIKLSTLNDGKFTPKFAQQQQMALFESDSDGTLKNSTQLQDIEIKKLFFNKRPLLNKQDTIPDKNFTEGALRIELVAPTDAFGHKLFPQIFPEVVLYNAKHSKKLELPNQPYIPTIRSLSIDYTLEHSEALNAKDKDVEETDLKVFHIYPFGYDEVYPGKAKAPYNLIPDFEQNNNLFIGLKNIKPGQVLSLLFQLEDNSFSDQAEAKTLWSYLHNNKWIDFTEKDILYDATNNFINTGIAELRLPGNFKTGNTIMSPALYWLRASSATNINARVKGIYTQAVTATRLVTDAAEVLNLQQGSIKTFKKKTLGIQSITQPFPSFGGKPAETDQQYYTRVSERLRHGQRLLTCRDIELAILEQFPEIYMAKCIEPKEYNKEYIEKYRPGLRVILVPKTEGCGVFTTEQPNINLDIKSRVSKFLSKSTPPFLRIEVKGPVYETIKVKCTVTFTDDGGISDTGMNIGRLNDDIKRFMCPWLFDENAEFKIGAGIYTIELFNFIKHLPYISDVSDLSLAHFYYDEATDYDELQVRARANYLDSEQGYIKGSLPQSVLIPGKNHLIIVAGESTDTDEKQIGISEFAVMEELLVNKKSNLEIVNDVETGSGIPTESSKSLFDLVISHNLD